MPPLSLLSTKHCYLSDFVELQILFSMLVPFACGLVKAMFRNNAEMKVQNGRFESECCREKTVLEEGMRWLSITIGKAWKWLFAHKQDPKIPQNSFFMNRGS